MTATQTLHDLGQSLWLDNITRDLLGSGKLRRYIQEFSVTGLTSNPTIFEHAISNSHDYDDAIRRKSEEGKSGETLFFELAIDDLTQAADLFAPIHGLTNGVDGWVSLEVSPCWPMTRSAPSPQPRNFTPVRHAPISSSRFRALRMASPPSRRDGGRSRRRSARLTN